MKNTLLFIWQILQNIVGVCYWLLSFAKIKERRNDIYILETDSKQGSVSLGNFVFISKYTRDREFTIKHELGHTIQSKYLGPLYLIVIGIPSLLWACFYKNFTKNYYWLYTESWANKLMNI